MMYGGETTKYDTNFPNPLAKHAEKVNKAYGIQYAKAIFAQWGGVDSNNSLYAKRMREFNISRDYAQGTQDTSIYKKLLTSLNPNDGDGSLLALDWTPVPIVPKFVKIVVNKILSANMTPNIEAVDPVSKTEKDRKKAKIKFQVENRAAIEEAQSIGIDVGVNIDALPQSSEEADILLSGSVKTDAEIAAQLATRLTLAWNEFDERIFRRSVEDLVVCGMAVIKRDNDPNYGIKESYVDPAYFIHSVTEDPSFSDLTYAGHIKRMSISELKRLAGDQLSEECFEHIGRTVMNKYNNNPSKFSNSRYDGTLDRYSYGYDEFTVEVLDFEFISVDDIIFEEKTSRFGNVGFYYKGYEYQAPKQSVYDRKPVNMQNTTLYGGKFIIGTDYIFDYGLKKNIPKNVHDLSRTHMSYSVIATNIRRMIPKSMVSSVVGFADQLQISHLKIQQSIAKAKPDGLIVDIEGLENVQLGRGGELQPLDIQDIYEQTGIFYYRSKNPDGSFANPPIRPLENSIRNINELIGTYNHYLRMIRDATGINEVVDASTPKGEQLVGVRQQAIQAANNALYDITNASTVLYRRVCADIVRCLQILPAKSVLFKAYENAVGKENMSVISSFRDLPMYNFGVRIVSEMNENDKVYLEQNIQIALAQKEIDLEDAIAIRQLKDVDQAEQLLIVRRKKRMRMQQQIAMQNSQMQAQANQQTAQAASQAKMQEEQMKAQLEAQKIQLESQAQAQLMELEYRLKMQLEELKGKFGLAQKEMESGSKKNLESAKEDRKDERIKKQAVQQSRMIAQRQGDVPMMEEGGDILTSLLGQK